jgi:pyruvate/2-oxoglutarate dehydrogenase complex dihydrolipoamide dehydrogenase (E3) component
MTDYDYDIGIIGGGAAGLTVASGASQLGAKTLLIEKEKELGGDCLHFGCVPSKTLIKSAHVYHTMQHAQEYGLPPVDLPPVDFSKVSERIHQVIAEIQKHDSVERFCGLGAKVEFGEPAFSDEHAVMLNGRMLSAKKWVIAAGTSPAMPPIDGLGQTAHLTNRDIFSLDHLPSALMILGAGPIGIEMAQAFSRLGSTVRVVDLASQILPKEDPDMAGAVMASLASEGVEFFLNTNIVGVRDTGMQKVVTIKNMDGQQTELLGDAILVALGRASNAKALQLDKCGVDPDPRGFVAVDKQLRTSQKHIYAAGDINGGFQFTHVAGYEGGIVISNAIFRLPRKVDYTYLPWCTYTDPELANIGMNETMAKAAGIDYTVISEEFKNNDRSLAEKQTVGKIKLLLDPKEKPIGVQIFGPHAGELLSEWVAVFNGGVKLSTLASGIHPYPTIGEINKKVAGSVLSPKIFSEKVKKGLKFFFHLKGRACSIDDCDS